MYIYLCLFSIYISIYLSKVLRKEAGLAEDGEGALYLSATCIYMYIYLCLSIYLSKVCGWRAGLAEDGEGALYLSATCISMYIYLCLYIYLSKVCGWRAGLAEGEGSLPFFYQLPVYLCIFIYVYLSIYPRSVDEELTGQKTESGPFHCTMVNCSFSAMKTVGFSRHSNVHHPGNQVRL